MYLIKNICFNHLTNNLNIENGIQMGISGDSEPIAKNDFWGSTEIWLGNYVDYQKFPVINEHCSLLTYVSEYEVDDIGDGFKKLSFNVSSYTADEVEGYIIIIKNSLDEIKTDGEKLFGRYPTEMVTILKDGNYIEFDGKRIEFKGERLMLLL